jgi:hypothetical protein
VSEKACIIGAPVTPSTAHPSVHADHDQLHVRPLVRVGDGVQLAGHRIASRVRGKPGGQRAVEVVPGPGGEVRAEFVGQHAAVAEREDPARVRHDPRVGPVRDAAPRPRNRQQAELSARGVSQYSATCEPLRASVAQPQPREPRRPAEPAARRVRRAVRAESQERAVKTGRQLARAGPQVAGVHLAR